MSKLLERMRGRIKDKKSSGQDEAIYPFWSIPTNQSTTIRFVNYEDDISGGFWTTRKALPMSFVDNKDDSKILKYRAPSLEMYEANVKCPVTNVVRALFSEAKELKNSGSTVDADAAEKVALSHWLKYSFYYQGFIINSGLAEDSVPENPIRIFPFTKKIHEFIEGSIMSKEDPMDFLPCGEFFEDDITALLDDDISGDIDEFMGKFQCRDFILKKTKQGEWNDYSTSQWRSKTDEFTDEQITAISEYGVHDLRKKLTKRPSTEQYEILTEMMNISIAYARGVGDGLWNPEWEDADIKPFREKNADTSTATNSGGSVKDRVKSRLGKGKKADADDGGTTAEDVRSKLGRGRGKAKKADPVQETADDSVVDEGDTAPVEEKPKASGKKGDRISALSQRIKERAAAGA